MPGPAVARKPWRSCRGHHDRHLDQARVQAASSPINSSLPAPGCGLLCHSRSTVSGWRPRWLLSPGAFVLHVLAFPMSPLGKESSAAGGIVLPRSTQSRLICSLARAAPPDSPVMRRKRPADDLAAEGHRAEEFETGAAVN